MDMIKRLPHRKLQIETLELDDYIPPKYNTFSTVRVLRVLNDNDRGSKRNLQRRLLKTVPSNSRVEFLSDSFCCELASQMLVSNLSDRLDTLQLDCLRALGANIFFHELKHAPVLHQFSLRSIVITLGNLETTHENAPSLRALRLEWIYIADSDGYLSNVMPLLI